MWVRFSLVRMLHCADLHVSQCAAGSVSVNGACQCDFGFYGTGISPTYVALLQSTPVCQILLAHFPNYIHSTGLDANGNGCTACPNDPNTGSMLTTYNYGATSVAQCVCDGTSGFIPGATSGTCTACNPGDYGFNGACVTVSSSPTPFLNLQILTILNCRFNQCDANTNSFDTDRGCICSVEFYGADSANGAGHVCSACPALTTTVNFPQGGATSSADCLCDPR